MMDNKAPHAKITESARASPFCRVDFRPPRPPNGKFFGFLSTTGTERSPTVPESVSRQPLGCRATAEEDFVDLKLDPVARMPRWPKFRQQVAYQLPPVIGRCRQLAGQLAVVPAGYRGRKPWLPR